jgi:hypothetical protein
MYYDVEEIRAACRTLGEHAAVVVGNPNAAATLMGLAGRYRGLTREEPSATAPTTQAPAARVEATEAQMLAELNPAAVYARRRDDVARAQQKVA